MDFSLAAEILAEMLTYIVDDAKKHAPNRHFASGQDSGGCAIGLPHAEARLACRKGPVTAMLCSAELRSRLCEAETVKRARAFPGKVDTGFPIGNATNIESRALSGHDPCNFRVNLIGKRSSAVNLKFLSLLAASSFRNFKFKTALES